MRQAQPRRHIPTLMALSLLCGCSTTANFSGQNAEQPQPLGWERIWRSARNAALAPETWVPVVGALGLQIGDADKKIQAWAAQQTPVFGSQNNADQTSDTLKFLSNSLWVASALAPGGSDEDGKWLINKVQVLGVQAGAGILLGSTVGYLKDETNRMRPNEKGDTSFPSDHASRSALHTTMTLRNVRSLGWSDNAVSNTQLGLYTLTAATAWARVEANQHYPSDVLCGIALGHFFGAFFTDAFLGVNHPKHTQVMFVPSRELSMLSVQINF